MSCSVPCGLAVARLLPAEMLSPSQPHRDLPTFWADCGCKPRVYVSVVYASPTGSDQRQAKVVWRQELAEVFLSAVGAIIWCAVYPE